jgi:acyl-CoA oxidase
MAQLNHFDLGMPTYPLSVDAAAGSRRPTLWARARSVLKRWVEPQAGQAGMDDPISGVFQRPELPSPEAEADASAATLTRYLYDLSPEHARFRERVKAVLASPAFARREGLTTRQQAEHSYACFKVLRSELDLRVRDVMERPARLTTVLELVAAVDATLYTVMSIHYCLCAGSILRHAQGPSQSLAPELARYIDELDSLESVGTFLVTELGYGNNVVSLQTRADYDEERREIRISTPCDEAIKFMPNTGLPGVPKIGVVMARLFVKGADQGVFPVVVRLRTADGLCPGVSTTMLGEKPGYSLDNAMTTFEGVIVSKECLLLGSGSTLSDDGVFESDIKSRRERFLTSMEQIQLGRLTLSAVASTCIGSSAFISIRYAMQRRTFAPRHADVSVLEYRNHQRDVFSALAYAYATRFMLGSVQRRYASAGPKQHDETFRYTSACKTHSTYAVERFSRLCRERCGAVALFEENRLSPYTVQAQGTVTAEGDNQISLIKIARQMLLGQGYDKLPRESDVMAHELGDPRRLVALLRSRERLLLNDLRRGMAPAMTGRNLFALWNENINLAIETASAHTSRLVMEAFWAAADRLHADSPVRQLVSLFGLQEIAPHLGFFLAEGLVTPEEVRGHSRSLDRECERIHGAAEYLTEALDIPNDVLRAPIAGDFVAEYAGRVRRMRAAAHGRSSGTPPDMANAG